ncbi:MAG: aminoacyl-tRNA hydrolase [Rickettsiales bacterium]|jgi:PTH1 family peptidyl-tRNA hydrolase|nr:aminoacyl-tRNA hydrolase [Rickettsiales bacterium]
MFLFVGLGNIGVKYENNRHNVGFMLVSRLIDKYNFIFEGRKKESDIFSGYIDSKKIVVIKPQTYMNNSGRAVQKIVNFFRIDKVNIYVFHDDMDLLLGRIKYKIGGSSGGHNGIKSIDNAIGNEYNRVRIGISHPDRSNNVADYVLGDFSLSDKMEIDISINKIVDNVDILLKNPCLFLSKINL